MEIRKKYYGKYLHDIAIEQIAEDYAQKGYQVSREERLGEYSADLVARKINDQIVIEVKVGQMTPEKKRQIAGLADYVKGLDGYRFLVVMATTPKEKKLEIDGLEMLLNNYIHYELPSELDELSTHTRPDEVYNISLNEIKISGKDIFVIGDGVVSIELQFGSDGDQDRDDGFKTYDKFPFNFDITLSYNLVRGLEIIEVNNFDIDISSYYDS